jgi:hypothetical protein
VGHQQRRYARTWHIALALATLTVLAGCANGRPAQQAGQAAGTEMPALAQSVLATDASSLREDWYRNSAEQQLTAQCIQRVGFAYRIPYAGPAPDLNTITEFALGRGNPEDYGVTKESLVDTPPSDPEAGKPGYQLALDGPQGSLRELGFPGGATVTYETGGCRGSARAQLYGSVDAYMLSSYLPQIEENLFQEFASRDSAYLRALRTWQECMRGDKFSVAGPGDAVSSLLRLADKTSEADLMRRQTALASADASCDRPSHLRQRTNQALGKFVRSLSRQTLKQLNDIAHTEARANQIARHVIGGLAPVRRRGEVAAGERGAAAGRDDGRAAGVPGAG